MAPDVIPSPRTAGRLTGVDFARALAVIGMVAVHYRPKQDHDISAVLHAIPHGRASVLFVLIAGVGIALLSGRSEAHPRARLRLFSFVLFLLPLGLWLQMLGHHVAVILQHYAAFYLLGIAALALPKRALAGWAIAACILGPTLYFDGQVLLPNTFARQPIRFGDTPVEIAVGLLVSGAYPLLSWAGPLLAGIYLGRQDLGSPAVRRALAVGGATVAALAFLLSTGLVALFGAPEGKGDMRFLLTDSPHSEMPLWIVGATGSAAMVLGVALHLADRFPRLLAPLVAMGQLALTIYVLHLLLLVAGGEAIRRETVLPSLGLVLGFCALAAAFATLWRSAFKRGPVEWAMYLTWEVMDATLPGGETPARAPAERLEPEALAAGRGLPKT